jgi:hypothetical protein
MYIFKVFLIFFDDQSKSHYTYITTFTPPLPKILKHIGSSKWQSYILSSADGSLNRTYTYMGTYLGKNTDNVIKKQGDQIGRIFAY